MSRRLQGSLFARGNRLRLVVLAAGCAIAGFAYRGYADKQDIADSNTQVLQLRAEAREARVQIAGQIAKIEDLGEKIKNLQAALAAIIPSENTYKIEPNQSLIVANGHLTVGLIGSPTNMGVNININGKPQSASTGDVINVAPDPSTACQVRVQSFDMFKAIVTASCAAAKPQ